MVTYNTLNCNGRLVSLNSPKVMGVLNLTPDSFYSGSRITEMSDLVHRAGKMVSEGAHFLDVGAMSSRPGAEILTPEAEWGRLEEPFRVLKKEFPDVLLSVDTLHSETAHRVLDLGADIINDISAGRYDSRMMEIVGQYPVPFIMMHMQGLPADMQKNPRYEDVVTEVFDYFTERIRQADQHGITDLILDPGFGFGKTIYHNYRLLYYLDAFRILRYPVLAGISRKGMIHRLLGTVPEHALNGTTAAHMLALSKGARILRVHDVKEAIECIRIWEQYKLGGEEEKL